MTFDEKLDHWIEGRGNCNLAPSKCTPKNCEFKASDAYKITCAKKDLYEWALRQKGDSQGFCDSIW